MTPVWPESRMRGAMLAVAAFVTVHASGHAAAQDEASLPVPQVTINPGEEIREGQLTQRNFPAAAARRGFVANAEEAVGKMSRRILMPGRPIPVAALREVNLVSAGDAVTIIFSNGMLEITGRAIALSSGRRGETIACRNVDSGVVVRGLVTDNGLVEVGRL